MEIHELADFDRVMESLDKQYSNLRKFYLLPNKLPMDGFAINREYRSRFQVLAMTLGILHEICEPIKESEEDFF